jgi:hypothetical protein
MVEAGVSERNNPLYRDRDARADLLPPPALGECRSSVVCIEAEAGAFIANKRSAKAPKYFARRRRSSCLMTSVNDPQSSSSSRFTAAQAGVFDLSHWPKRRASRYGTGQIFL